MYTIGNSLYTIGNIESPKPLLSLHLKTSQEDIQRFLTTKDDRKKVFKQKLEEKRAKKAPDRRGEKLGGKTARF